MTQMNGRGINYEGSAAIGRFEITKNTIESQDDCIRLGASTGTNGLKIEENELTLQPRSYGLRLLANRAAIRVFSIGQNTLNVANATISKQETNPITIHGYGKGIALENVNDIQLNYNTIEFASPTGSDIASEGILFENAGTNHLYGNNISAAGVFPNVRNISLAASPDNTLCCNSTDGGEVGLFFFGDCDMTGKLNNTTMGSHEFGLFCAQDTYIGNQDHRGNTWLTGGGYGTAAAQHEGTDDQILASIFQVEGSPGTEYWPAEDLISTPNASDAEWFRFLEGNTIACADNTDCEPIPDGDPPRKKESDEKVAEGDYASGKYAVVHNWESGLDLFARLEKNESLRNSEAYYQTFYAQANTAAIGEYTRVREQFKALLSLSGEEQQHADALWTDIQSNLENLTNIGVAYSQATTEADRTVLEAAWQEQYAKVSDYFADWQTLSASINQRMEGHIPALQAANAVLPEDIVPAANEKLMNTIQLQRMLGEALTEKQYAEMVDLAFSCPLEAGNAVYRARTLLRTLGNYVFDDASICGLEEGITALNMEQNSVDAESTASAYAAEWRIYPNPAQGQVWLKGPQGASLTKIQLYDHVGRIVLTEPGAASSKQQLSLPTSLSAGIYFLIFEQADGTRQTRKLIIKP